MSRFKKSDLPRVRYLREQHWKSVNAHAEQQNLPPRLRRSKQAPFEYLIAFDPTPKAIYLDRIIRWFFDRAIQMEDARIVRDTLAAFHEKKHLLPEDKRDASAYERPGDMAKLLAKGRSAVVTAVPLDIAAESLELARGEDWSIHRILTPNAARWWAKSTSWCTASKSTAEDYLAAGSLLVMTHGDEKWQIHQHSAQVMDRYDRPANDFSTLPDEALEAVVFATSEKPFAGASFYRADVATMFARHLTERRGGNMPPARYNMGSIWHHPGSGYYLRIAPSFQDPKSSRLSLREGHSLPFDTPELQYLVADFARFGIQSGSKGRSGVLAIRGGMEFICHHPGFQSQASAIVEDGQPTVIVNRLSRASAETSCPFFIISDLRGKIIETTIVEDAKGFALLPGDLRAYVQQVHRNVNASVGVLLAMGLDVMDDAGRDRLRKSPLDLWSFKTLDKYAVTHGESSHEFVRAILDAHVASPRHALEYLQTVGSHDADSIVNAYLVEKSGCEQSLVEALPDTSRHVGQF